MSDRIHSSDLFFGDYEFDGYDFRGNPRWRSSGQVVIEMRELVGWVFATPERVVKNIGNSFAKLPNLAQWDGWLLRPAHKIANSDEFQMKYASKDYSSSIAPEKKHAASKSSMARLPYGDQKETRFASETEMVSSFGGNPRIFARFGGGHALLPFREAEDATKISMPFGDFYVSRRMEDIDKVVLNESRYQIIRQPIGEKPIVNVSVPHQRSSVGKLHVPIVEVTADGLVLGAHLKTGANPALYLNRKIEDLSKNISTRTFTRADIPTHSEPRAAVVHDASIVGDDGKGRKSHKLNKSKKDNGDAEVADAPEKNLESQGSGVRQRRQRRHSPMLMPPGTRDTANRESNSQTASWRVSASSASTTKTVDRESTFTSR
eukprot:GEMP01049867.1.p1 GENE.GEMP01049867.1~~GEMP01049867.1.p1  ORF type:complete len:376 (+),score=80.64 GEMP01049867.1:298-1425(+)